VVNDETWVVGEYDVQSLWVHKPPAGARKFGNILDPNSEVSYILRTKKVFIQLKEETGNNPRFYYYFDV
jgi:Fe-S-cluster-containing dehydrogenase component